MKTKTIIETSFGTIKGDNMLVTGNNNTVYGNNNVINGNSNIVLGEDNDINGEMNIVSGHNNNLTGKYNKNGIIKTKFPEKNFENAIGEPMVIVKDNDKKCSVCTKRYPITLLHKNDDKHVLHYKYSIMMCKNEKRHTFECPDCKITLKKIGNVYE